ncbi:MAG: glycosyltransferase family 39 protein, partial [Solirubrobacteraceae bacterium]
MLEQLRSGRGRLAAAAGIVAGALVLRLWGIGHGLPYVYNADENAHFVPRAVGMFGHSYDPGYFINPPAYTYLLHLAFDLRWGGREAVGDALAADRTSVFELARVVAALLGTLAVALLLWAGRRLLGAGAGLVAGALLAVAFLPVHYSHLALNDVPALAGVCLTLVGVAAIYRRNGLGGYALAGAALGVACATKYTAGILV